MSNPVPAASPPDAERAELDTLRRQYFALVPPYLLSLPGPAALRGGQAALARLAEEEPQPEAGYRRGFWRRVLPLLEAVEGEDDGLDAIYEAVAECMALPSLPGPPPPSPKTFIYPSTSSGRENRITLYEEQVAVQAGTTGLRTWTAALHLAHHFLRAPEALFGRAPGPVVELGAGTGFLSLVLAAEGADVLATDLGDEEEGGRQAPLSRLRDNFTINGADIPALPLDWAHAAFPPAARPGEWTRVLTPVAGRGRDVLAADVVYDPEIVPLLVDAIGVLLREGGCGGESGVAPAPAPVAVLAATVRNEETFALFLSTCAESGLATSTLPLQPMDPDRPTFWDTALDRGTRVAIVRITTE